MPSRSLKSLSEPDLAEFQTLQTGNNCGLHSLNAAIRMLTGFDLPPQWLSAETDRLWWRGRFFRVFPGWAITPQQLARLANYLAKRENLPISAQVLHLSRQVLQNLISDEDLACLVTIYWRPGKTPPIYHWNSPGNINRHHGLQGHTMLLAAYNPTHYNGQVNTPWGFINSWSDRGAGLFWMDEINFEQAWGFPLPLIGNHAAVILSLRSSESHNA